MHKHTNITLVTGGARSGKSDFALRKASAFSGGKVFLATAEPLDEEMRRRVEEHRKNRGQDWETIEEPLNICGAIREAQGDHGVILLDCLTLWVSNLLTRASLEENSARERIDEFAALLPSLDCNLLVVTNEVGMGVVPENPLARLFRDLAGLANRKVAEAADEAYLMVSGLPVKLK
jgi:adenosyl cobinamide kinase/adenosyl cobinamide phosphate guanylyltransferase